ncbi:hypothetical protein BH10PSE17_BH10PSE17_14340 [soil metagenome]
MSRPRLPIEYLHDWLLTRATTLRMQLVKPQARPTVRSPLGVAPDLLSESEGEAKVLRQQQVELIEVVLALQRLSDGVYGHCIECGRPIALRVLRAAPAMARCEVCQLFHDRV